MNILEHVGIGNYITLSALLFCVGAFGLLYRRNAIIMFMSIEIMLNAVNLLLVAFSSYHEDPSGQVFVFFTMANISLPGTSSFIGEFLVLTGTYQNNSFVAMLASTGMVLGAAYALWLCNRLLYGVTKPHFITSFSDISRREFFMFLPFKTPISL